MSEKIPKDILGVAGEFAVASELCKRGLYAQLTLGNRKRTDLLVENDEILLSVEVKSKQGPVWPAVKGISKEGSFIVFVDFHDKAMDERPDFYVLTLADWKAYAKKKVKESNGGATLQIDNLLVWNGGKFKGTSVKPIQIMKHKDAWNKFNFGITT